jgi:hypothetical protein
MDLSKNPNLPSPDQEQYTHIKEVLLPTAVKKLFSKDSWKEKKKSIQSKMKDGSDKTTLNQP